MATKHGFFGSLHRPGFPIAALSEGGLFGAGTAAGDYLGSEAAGLSLDFTEDSALVRGHTANFSGTPTGLLTYTSPSPKLVWDVAGVLGYASHNLMLQSQTFDNASWVKTQSEDVAVTANQAVAPDGTLTADLVVPATGSGYHVIRQSATVVASVVTFAVDVKPAGYTKVAIREDFAVGQYASFNCSGAGSIISQTAGVVASITALSDGWYRCVLTPASASANQGMGIYIMDAAYAGGDPSSGQNYSGDGTSGVYLWGAQMNLGPTALTYLPTTTAARYAIPLDHDPVTHEPKGVLVEEQRTNLCLYSQEINNAASWTANGATGTANSLVAPDGTTTADTLTEDGTTGPHTRYQSISVTNGLTYTFSAYVKKGTRNWFAFEIPAAFGGAAVDRDAYFNVDTGVVGSKGASITSHSIRDVGNGWYRCIVTATAAATVTQPMHLCIGEADLDLVFAGVNGAAALYVWGVQLEAGSFATSYIPTAGSQVTRAADNITLATSAFPYSATEGTLVWEGVSGGGHMWSLDNGTTDERLQNYSAPPTFFVADGGAGQVNLQAGSGSVGDNWITASAWAENSFALSRNGGAAQTAATGTLPTPTVLRFGAKAGVVELLGGHIKKLKYLPRRATNTETEALAA